jgi:hypothetical protein
MKKEKLFLKPTFLFQNKKVKLGILYFLKEEFLKKEKVFLFLEILPFTPESVILIE